MMQDNDYNIIKPVETMQNVGSLSPIDQHAQRKKNNRQNSRKQAPHRPDAPDESSQLDDNKDMPGSIDYRA